MPAPPALSDYGLAPNRSSDGQDLRCRDLFRLRKNTKLIETPRFDNLHDFLRHLANSTTDVTIPIQNILLGAHASRETHFRLDMYKNQGRPPPGENATDGTEYETLERTEDTTNHPERSILVDNALTGQDPSKPITHFVHIKGCNIGNDQAKPFLVKMKEALGGNVIITAPKHFHGIDSKILQLGVFEFMKYEFFVQRPARLPDRATIFAEFKAERDKQKWKFLGGNPVMDSDLDAWIPKKESDVKRRRKRRTTTIWDGRSERVQARRRRLST